MPRNWNRWCPDQLAELVRIYPDHTNVALAARFGRTVCSINGVGDRLGLKKSAEHLRTHAGRITVQSSNAIRTRFQPGQRPWNKGRPYPARGRSAATQFGPGKRQGRAALLHQPVGALRKRPADGYWVRKINDAMPMHRRWRAEHLLIWEAAHGPLPAGHAVAFRDANPDHLALDNLELVTRGELMRRNSIHTRLPPDVRHAAQSLGQLKRRLREGLTRLERQHETSTATTHGNPTP